MNALSADCDRPMITSIYSSEQAYTVKYFRICTDILRRLSLYFNGTGSVYVCNSKSTE